MNERAPERTRLLPIVIGFVLAGLLILVLGFWVALRPRNSQPTVRLISPAGDTMFAESLLVQFETSLPLGLQPTGWANGRYHLHALLDNNEVMAAATDIRSLGGNRYEWTLRGIRSPARLRLVWALPNHGRVVAGGSRTILVRPLPVGGGKGRG